jgi:hypothetical protein
MFYSCLAVSESGIEVEVSRILGVEAAERDMTVAAADVESLLERNLILLISDFDNSSTSDIDYAYLAALGEIFGAKNLRRGQDKLLFDRNCASCYDTVKHGVDHINLVRNHQILNEIVLTKLRGVVMLRIVLMGRITNFAIDSHDST